RLILRQAELETDVRIQTAVGDVMDDLSPGPAAFPVRRVELGFRQTVRGGSQRGGHLGELGDPAFAARGGDFSLQRERSNRVARIGHRLLPRSGTEPPGLGDALSRTDRGTRVTSPSA